MGILAGHPWLGAGNFCGRYNNIVHYELRHPLLTQAFLFRTTNSLTFLRMGTECLPYSTHFRHRPHIKALRGRLLPSCMCVGHHHQ